MPDDATVVVIAGPKTDLLPQELTAVKAYLARGGKLMLMLDPPDADTAGSSLTSLVELARSVGSGRRQHDRHRRAERQQHGDPGRRQLSAPLGDRTVQRRHDGVPAGAIGGADRRRHRRQDRAEAARDQRAKLGGNRPQDAVRDQEARAEPRQGRQIRAGRDRDRDVCAGGGSASRAGHATGRRRAAGPGAAESRNARHRRRRQRLPVELE